MAERLRARIFDYGTLLNHSIISPLCLVWVRAPHGAHVREAKFSLRVCLVFFLRVPLTEWHVSYELKYYNLARDVNLNKKNRIIKDQISGKRSQHHWSSGYYRSTAELLLQVFHLSMCCECLQKQWNHP